MRFHLPAKPESCEYCNNGHLEREVSTAQMFGLATAWTRSILARALRTMADNVEGTLLMLGTTDDDRLAECSDLRRAADLLDGDR